MRLDVGIFGIIDLAKPVDGDLFDLVDHVATSVVPFARIAFSIFIGEDRPHGFEHIVTNIVL